MYFNRDALTIDMGYVNQQRPRISQETQYTSNVTPPSLSYPGCQTEKQCRQINEELDDEERRLRRLRSKYDMKEFTRNQYDTMYMIDPTSDSPKSRQVTPDPWMYTLDPGSSGGCTDSLINPNAGIRINPDHEEYTLLPSSGNQPVLKREIADRQKFRIYPHMFGQTRVLQMDEARRREENSALMANPSLSLGGVNYPVPQYYKLSPLLPQQGCVNNGETGGVDYDMRIEKKSHLVPVPLQMQNSDDINRSASVVGCGQRSRLSNDRRGPEHPFGRTAGVPASDCNNFSRAQRTRQVKQNIAVLGQQFPLTCNKSTLGISNDSLSFRNRGPTKSELNTFGGTGSVSTKLPPGPQYPSQQDEKSGFFELGPVIPPPNPLLLSNVPSRILQTRQAIDAPQDSAYALRQRILSESFDGNPNTELQPLQVIASSGAIARGSGSKFGRSDLHGVKITTSEALSGAPDRERPNGFLASEFGTESTYQAARSSYERDLQLTIDRTITQQSKTLMRISDLRHAITGLKQRVVESRAHNDVFDVAGSDQRIRAGLKLIDDLRDAIRAVTERRSRAIQELKRVLTEKEFGFFETQVANKVKLMETQAAQYHSQPPADKVECFRAPHFAGDGFIMGADFYNAPQVGGVGNNELMSLKIGSDVMVKLYANPNRQGRTLTYIGPRRVTLLPTMWTRTVSGIEVTPKQSPTMDAYDAPFFQGGHIRLTEGEYDYPSVGGVGGGKLSSMSIPDGFEITIYSRPGFQGERVKYKGPQKLPFLPADWNTKVMGIQVEIK